MSGTTSAGPNPALSDLYHYFGNDLSVDATGDLQAASGSELGQERVIRRLLTNPGSYLWNLIYGAGLAEYIGRPAAPTRISAVAQAQMALEAAVSQSPPPSIGVTPAKNGTVTLSISYVDAASGTTQVLSLPVGG